MPEQLVKKHHEEYSSKIVSHLKIIFTPNNVWQMPLKMFLGKNLAPVVIIDAKTISQKAP